MKLTNSALTPLPKDLNIERPTFYKREFILDWIAVKSACKKIVLGEKVFS